MTENLAVMIAVSAVLSAIALWIIAFTLLAGWERWRELKPTQRELDRKHDRAVARYEEAREEARRDYP